MDFVKFELSQNPEQKCHCCNSFIKYVVTLSDGNKYGKDCAKRLISGTVINRAEREYFDKNSPIFKVGILFSANANICGILNIKAKSESDAIRIYHKNFNSDKNRSIWKGARCLWRGKTLGTQYETTIDKFVIVP